MHYLPTERCIIAFMWAVKKPFIIVFFSGYQKMFKKTFLPGAAVSFFSMFVLLNGTFLTVMNLQPLYVVLQLAVIFLLFYVVALVPFMATEQGKMKGYRMALKENFFRGILGSAASTLIIGGSLYLGRLIIFPVILGFSLGALVQEHRTFWQTVYPRRRICEYDDAGSIGKRYRRQDEIGTPLCITIDFDTLEDQAVTVRDRDTMEQVRLSVFDLVDYVEKKLDF